MELEFRQSVFTHYYTNKQGQSIKFELLDDKHTCVVSDCPSGVIRKGEEEQSAIVKKNQPNREIKLIFAEPLGGPFIALGFNLEDFLLSKQAFLESKTKKTINKIEVIDSKIYITYEESPIRKESKTTEKNTTQETES